MKNWLFLMMLAAATLTSCSPRTSDRMDRDGDDSVIQDVGQAAGDVAEGVADGVEEVGEGVKEGAEEVVEEVDETVTGDEEAEERQNEQMTERGIPMGKTWRLYTYGLPDSLQNVSPDMEFTFQLDPQGNRITGRSGCNTYSGSLRGETDDYRFGEITGTQTKCPDENLTKMESDYLLMLSKVKRYSMQDDMLVLETEDGRHLVFRITE